MMEPLRFPLFLLNIILVLLDASLGYHLIPRLLTRTGDPETVSMGVRACRGMLPVVVLLYMFFNCFGYFRLHPLILIMVCCLTLTDLALQAWRRRREPLGGKGRGGVDR